MNRLLSKTVDESAESKAAIDTLHCSTFISLQEENFIRQVFSDITQFSRHSNFSGNHCVVVFVSLLRAQGDGRFSLQALFILTKWSKLHQFMYRFLFCRNSISAALSPRVVSTEISYSSGCKWQFFDFQNFLYWKWPTKKDSCVLQDHYWEFCKVKYLLFLHKETNITHFQSSGWKRQKQH